MNVSSFFTIKTFLKGLLLEKHHVSAEKIIFQNLFLIGPYPKTAQRQTLLSVVFAIISNSFQTGMDLSPRTSN